ncbi:hypothetical protein [Mesorhizobium sp.]|uniref:hypothetical protein n=1 Tax=Mesorhizobium sp. TaxID=1871066 RepID=UPI0025C0FBB8|nr:hypothetical protein [Mesorhizobium sp.]
MTESNFAIGDEVMHRIGGKKMIYTEKSMDGEAICEWFDGTRRHQDVDFHPELSRVGA